jgi:predicted small lipoprotein YifL
MKRFLGVLVLLAALALVAACGSGGGEEQPAADVGASPTTEEGQAPPAATAVATPTAESTPSPASGLREQMGELVLSEGDVPAGFSSLGSMDLDMSLDFLGLPSPQGGAAHMSMFATPGSKDIIVSMVILMKDDTALQEAFSQIENLSIEEIQKAFSMMGANSNVTLLDTRELDVSGLGDRAYGLGLTMEMPQVGTMDSEMVFFGDGPLLAVAMTMAMGGGTAVDVLPLAQTMADKIEAAVQ